MIRRTLESVPTRQERDNARALVLRYGRNATAFQILNPGLSLWFAPQGNAVVGYVTSSGFRVVAGCPICPPEDIPAIAAAFEHDTYAVHKRVCYFGAQHHLVAKLRQQRPIATMLLGAQPTWNPQNWPDIVRRKASLRGQLARARNKHVTIASQDTRMATTYPHLRACLNQWLETRKLPPMHFLIEPDTLQCLQDRRVYIARRAEVLVGFLVASPVPLRNGWLIEQIIRGHDAPNGTSELLLDAAMRDTAADGATYLTLGLSPLSRRAGIPRWPEPIWLRIVLAWVRLHGQRFYNFDGLDAFKAKALPEHWEPIYALTPEARISPQMLYAIAGAFSGTSPLLFLALSVLRAGWQEVRWLWRAVRAGRVGA